MPWLVLIKSKIARWATAAALVIAAFLALQARSRAEGAKSARQEAKEADHNEAQRIRDAVRTDRASRLHTLDDAGWRD